MVASFSWPFVDMAITGADPDPTVTELEVIGAGLPRTATASLQHALVILGFGPCHHGASLFRNPGRILAIRDAFNGKPTDYRQIMAGYRSTTDGPMCHLVPELLAAYPKAKVILTLRDTPEAWGRSFQQTIMRMADPKFTFAILPLSYIRRYALMSIAATRQRWIPLYGKERTVEVYNRHNDWIRSVVPKEQLLEFNVKEGWEPLCKFLGVPVPNVPFPRTNESAMLNKNVDDAIRIGLTLWAVIALGGVGTWYLVYHYMRYIPSLF